MTYWKTPPLRDSNYVCYHNSSRRSMKVYFLSKNGITIPISFYHMKNGGVSWSSLTVVEWRLIQYEDFRKLNLMSTIICYPNVSNDHFKTHHTKTYTHESVFASWLYSTASKLDKQDDKGGRNLPFASSTNNLQFNMTYREAYSGHKLFLYHLFPHL